MLDKDFDWCFNHENLFRDWLYFRYDCIHSNELDPATIFDLWQDAKKYALEIANSKDPVLFYWTKMDYWIAESRRHIFWLSDSCQQASLLLKFLNSMLASSKNKKLELFADIGDNVFIDYVIKWKKDPNSKFELDTKPFYGMIHPLLMPGQIESDYDYSLPDGGIKDETQTKTDAGTKTITDETEEESVDVILQNYKSFNNEGFISAIRKAIEKGLIEKKEDGKYKWVGPKEIYKGNSDSVLTYFIGKALNLKTDVEKVKDPATDKMKEQLTYDSRQDAINRFPKEEINSLFGKSLIISQWKQIFTVQKKQVWREVIDKFFDENKENKENNIQ